ncbi:MULTISPECIES: MerR family transcriptional regulator [Eggerthellaceae]|uniref:MerR family transcriptional regulator n=1 Tax=Eggerthellaceae TaxID=1643826 RepID=UPI001D075963|nr:MerR family transcriptional regulator [Gordonibacter urolithinfaciens]MCB6560628.1 MerR family transcriptional regulator [Gordonibacter urolithinfaciens]
MKIGEFSERTGLPVSTLHFYERKGLICPERNRSGHREYSDADLSWVAFIERLKETGMPLAQIKRYADLRAQGDSTMEERMDMLTSHRERVLGEMAKWRENLSHLDDKIAYYESKIEKEETEGKPLILQQSSPLDDYLAYDEIIDFHDADVAALAHSLHQDAADDTDFIRIAYEFVRDSIPHSADIDEDALPCSASDVLTAGHGICFAKSHLLAALLRCEGVPAGLCYQRIVLDDKEPSTLVLHGLNGVYLEDEDRWIRLDARGNKGDIDAQFSLDGEQLAYPIRPNLGEADLLGVFAKPIPPVVEALQKNSSRSELWQNLPSAIED